MSKKTVSSTTAFLLVGLIIFIVICVPLAGIWALNTLFQTSIPYDFETWFAMTVLCVCLKGK